MKTSHKMVAIYVALVLVLLLVISLNSCAVVTINTGEDLSLDTDDKKKPLRKKAQGLVKKLIK